MTETEASAGPCHERLVFPWTGVLLRDETIEDFPVRAGEHVKVEEKQNRRFRVTVPRQGATRSEWVAPSSVDEVLGAAVDLYLLGKPNISWGSGGAWRNRGRATQEFSLREEDEIPRAGTAVRVPGEAHLPDADEWDVLLADIGARPVPRSKVELVTGEAGLPRRTDGRGSSFYFQGTLREDHTIPGGTTLVEAGDEIQAQPSPRKSGWYLVSKPNTPGEAEVPGAMLEMDLAVPPSTSQVELMCYELAPYAAALARLRPGFVAAANSRSGSSAGGSEYWAETFGTDFGTEKVLWTDLPALRLQRGDLVAFTPRASGRAKAPRPIWRWPRATARASTRCGTVRSIYPVRVGLAELWAGEMQESCRS